MQLIASNTVRMWCANLFSTIMRRAAMAIVRRERPWVTLKSPSLTVSKVTRREGQEAEMSLLLEYATNHNSGKVGS